MTKETFEQMALRVADEQSIIWREDCTFESGIVADEAIAFATAIRNELAKGAEPVFKVYRGELCYRSQEDDQSFGMWCPVTPDYSPPLPQGTELYAYPPSAAARIEELEAELAAEKESQASAHADALRQAEHLGQSVARIAELKKQRDDLLAVLDQAANGQHLDDVPNHDDDSLRSIAYHLPDKGWGRNALLRHAERIDVAIANVKGGAA